MPSISQAPSSGATASLASYDLQSSTHSDVLILGAGVAGLACARMLTQKGLRVRVLEARPRMGGRILTARDPILRAPIELGAEFIHGSASETYDLAQHFGLTTFDVSEEHFRATTEGPQRRDGEWSSLMELLGQLKETEVDISFADFLKSQTSLPAEIRDLAQGFVEGFHAADARQISCNSLADDDGASSTDAQNSARLLDGYEKIPEALYQACTPENLTLHLNTVVREIHWRRGRVDVVAVAREGSSPKQFSANRAVIALPWGVLQTESLSPAQQVKFEPEPDHLARARGAIAMGHAARVALHFRKRFWTNLTREPIGYLHGDANSPFPVWWTPQPCNAPVWVGWVGGPKAQALSQLGEGKILDKAIEALGKSLGVGAREISKNLQTWHYHDWSNDPFARGAYSFVRVGGMAAADGLAVPVQNTLFFAGEATQSGSGRGTVDGALRSGYLAAEYILSQPADPGARQG